MLSRWRRLFLAGALSLLLMSPAFAAGARIRIGDPLPEELKERVSDLMRSLRPDDADAALAAARIIDGPLWRQNAVLLLRIETDCRDDLCMVVIGRVTDRAIIPEVTLRAGPNAFMGDGGRRIWGFVGSPMAFQGRDGSGLLVYSGPNGWLVEACATCFRPLETRQPVLPTPPPPAKLPEKTFEEFRRELRLEP